MKNNTKKNTKIRHKIYLCVLAFLMISLIYQIFFKKPYWMGDGLEFRNFKMLGKQSFPIHKKIIDQKTGKLIMPSTVFIQRIAYNTIYGLRRELDEDDKTEAYKIQNGKREKVIFPDNIYFSLEIKTGKLKWFTDYTHSKELNVRYEFD